MIGLHFGFVVGLLLGFSRVSISLLGFGVLLSVCLPAVDLNVFVCYRLFVVV